MRLASRRNALALTWISVLLLSQVPVAHAQDTVPQTVRDYAQPGETIQAITPIRYRGDVYRVYYFADAPLDDLYGNTLNSNGRDTLDERGIRALLVTRNDRVADDEETIRNILLLARTSYMLHRTTLPEAVTPIDEGLVDQVESLRENPIFVAAFAEQYVRALFETRKEQSAEALVGILTAQQGKVDVGAEFSKDVMVAVDSLGNAGEALDYTIQVAKYSNDPKIRALAKRSREVLKDWKKASEQGRSFMDTRGGRIEFANGLEILGFGVQMVFLSDLQKERSDWLALYREHFRSGNAAPDKDQLGAISLAQAEVENDWLRRGVMTLDFVRDKASELSVKWAAERLAREWVEFSWKQWGTRTTGHLAAGAASKILLAYTLANLLYGMNDIWNNFTTADRAAELLERFRAGRLELQGRDWAEEPKQYDGDLAEAYRVAYLLEAFSGCQVYRSYAEGVASSRAILALADLVSGGQWTLAIEGFRRLADQYEKDAENRLGHPDLIDRAVEMAVARIATKSPGWHNATMIRSPSPLILHPSESGEIVFEVQNTGKVNWLPPQDFALMNTNGVNLGALPIQPLINEIPVGRVSRWVIPVTAPPTNGLKLTEWQIAYREGPFGERMFCLVIVVPEGELDIDPGALLAQWLDKLTQRLQEELDRIREDLTNRLKDWLQRELERVVSNLLKTLSEQCGGATVMAPAALLVGISVTIRTRRKRRRDRD